jgi:hypothetical protein
MVRYITDYVGRKAEAKAPRQIGFDRLAILRPHSVAHWPCTRLRPLIAVPSAEA